MNLADARAWPVDFITLGLFFKVQVQPAEVLECQSASSIPFQLGPSDDCGGILFRTAEAAKGISPTPPTIPHLVAKV